MEKQYQQERESQLRREKEGHLNSMHTMKSHINVLERELGQMKTKVREAEVDKMVAQRTADAVTETYNNP